MIKRPIIIDTDPGVDDTIAIMLANADPSLDIKAITPVTGNVQYALTSRNALFLREYLDMDCKVGDGAHTPLFIENKDAGDIHGTGGMGGYRVPTPQKGFDGYAWDIIKEEAEKAGGELEIVTLGPLTNIAITLLRYPEIKPLIKRIVCMAGTGGTGNMNRYAEFNVWIDPEAADIVFKSGVPVTMCGLDGNDFCGITIDELNGYLEKVKGSKIEDLFSHIFKHFVKRRIAGGPEDCIQVINDAITMAYLIDGNLGKTQKCFVQVETKGTVCAGQTIVDFNGISKQEPNVDVLVWSDKKMFTDMLDKMIEFYKN